MASNLSTTKHVSILNNKLVVRINLLDNSETVLLVNPEAKVEEVVEATCKKLELPEDDADLPLNFSLHECLDGVTISRPLPVSKVVQEVMEAWPAGGSPKLVFQVKLYTEGLLSHKEPNILSLMYIQAVYNVICGIYQLTQEDAIRAGALQMFVKFGAHNPDLHKPGFLTNTLLEYVPGTMIRNRQPEEWEEDLFAVHAKLDCADVNAARQDYLDLCAKLAYYGCTMFAVRQMFDKKMARNLILGVNYSGIILVKPGDLKSTFTMETIMKHSLNDIFRWAYKPGVNFYFEVKPEDDDDENPLYTFSTSEGKHIADLLTDYAMGMLRDMGLNPDGTKRDGGDAKDDDATDAEAGGAGPDATVTAPPEDIDLPEGWVPVVDESSGNTYYYNEDTGDSSWEVPTE